MRKQIFKMLTVMFFMSAVTFAYAQDHEGEMKPKLTPEQKAEKQTNRMKENLSLSADQVPKVQEINLKYAQKMHAVREGDEAKLERATKIKALSDEKDQELKNVLTAEQFVIYEKNKEEKKGKMRDKAREKREGTD